MSLTEAQVILEAAVRDVPWALRPGHTERLAATLIDKYERLEELEAAILSVPEWIQVGSDRDACAFCDGDFYAAGGPQHDDGCIRDTYKKNREEG